MMMLRKFISVVVAAWVASATEQTDSLLDSENSYTTDTCVSVIAISGTPDYRYLEENSIDVDVFDEGEEFVCEQRSGLTVPIKGTNEQMDKLRLLLQSGELVSSEMTIGIADNLMSLPGDDAVYLPFGDIIIEPRVYRTNANEPRRMLKGRTSNNLERNLVRPNLPLEGAKPILVVRVTDSDGKVHPDTPAIISDKIFGTSGDSLNAKSQFAACSFGKLQITNDYSVDISEHESAKGVIDVTIDKPLVGNNRGVVRSAVITAVQNKLNIGGLPGPFQHVMVVVEGCYTDCGWAAYAYVNSWLSVYQADNYKYVGVQLHELGHNLNMAHSGGLDGRTYTDHSCLMGNPWYEDNRGAMCYNPAKTFQIARGGSSWYNDNTYDTIVWNSETVRQWSGEVIGLADYKNNPNNRPIVVKLESLGPNDWFVGFNRAVGINKDTAAARDKVTVMVAGSDGLGYSRSSLRAVLSQGEMHRVPNWQGSGEELTIFVREINLNANPVYADVIMRLGDSATPTAKPSLRPSSGPTKRPTPLPSTAKPSLRPSSSPTTRRPTPLPSKEPSSSPSKSTVIWSTCGNSVCDSDEDSDTCPGDCEDKELETTFEYNLGSGGSMFTVEAKRNIVVSSFAINSSSRGEGAVKVYTRTGSYNGHEKSSEGWELIYDDTVMHAPRGQPTELGEFQKKVMILEGVSQSFFVSSSQNLVYKSGTQEGKAFASDESLSILEGIGTDVAFTGKVYSPRLWGGRLHYKVVKNAWAAPTMSPIGSYDANTCGDSVCTINEDFDSCPADCAGKELETTFEFSLGSSGNIFTVEALRDVSISSFVINTMRKGEGTVKVYTKGGSYSGYEQNREEWKLIYEDPSVYHNGRGKPTGLGDFNNPVSIDSGSTQSFFVTSSKGLVYQVGTEEGKVFASDESLVVYEGIGTTAEFTGDLYKPRVFGGKIRYDARGTSLDVCGDSVCAMTEDSETCPADCAGKELETTFEFSLGSSGNIFTVEALRDVSISSFVINTMRKGEGTVKVFTKGGSYSGYEQNREEWKLIYEDPSVYHKGRGKPTELGDFNNPVPVAGGSTQSFFVTSSKGLVYKAGTEEGKVFASDESLVIYEGIGTTAEFTGDLYRSRVFGGKIRYDIPSLLKVPEKTEPSGLFLLRG